MHPCGLTASKKAACKSRLGHLVSSAWCLWIVYVTDFPGMKQAHILGRVYTVNPCQGECFYLRLLLHTNKRPQSFAHLRTVEGNLYSSFREACLRLGLLEDKNQYQPAMQEAAVSNSAASLLSLFAVILTWCEPSNPLDICDHHKKSMAEDFLHQQRTRLGNSDFSIIFNLALNDLQRCIPWEVGNCLSMASQSHRQWIVIGLPEYTTGK